MRDDVEALAGDLVDLRRRPHRTPELGLQLPRTQETVLEALDGLSLEVTMGTTTTSVTAVLRGTTRERAVLLRGNMDALPVDEQSGRAVLQRGARRDARLRSRPAHGDARRCQTDVPAGRGGLGRRVDAAYGLRGSSTRRRTPSRARSWRRATR